MPNSLCTMPGCTKPIMYKKLGLCQNHYQQQRRKNDKPEPEPLIPASVINEMQKAQSDEDWKKLAAALTPAMAKIMSGAVNASAAQVSLIKDVMNRAYGKPVATQTDRQVSTGVVLLPVQGAEANSFICPKCMFNAIDQLQNDSTKELAVKVLKELLERLIANNQPTGTVVS